VTHPNQRRQSSRGTTYLGLDVSKASISVGILHPRDSDPVVERISHDEASIRRFLKAFPDKRLLATCYEAGPTGYELHRLLVGMGIRCDVVAPTLIPKSAGDRVKTDKRDAKRLARLHRAGELRPIRVPTRAEEAARDLCRARAALVRDVGRARKRVLSLLLRHSVAYTGGHSHWTRRHRDWLAARHFPERATDLAFRHLLQAVHDRERELAGIEGELLPYLADPLFADAVTRLCCYRGIAEIGALTIVTEVCDFCRFPSARSFMGFCGLGVSEYSSGQSVRRGHLTKTGNRQVRNQLVESAWTYQHLPIIGVALKRRQREAPNETLQRSWAAQVRLHRRYWQLSARKLNQPVVIGAVARELAGFVWAEMVA
jgi:transposase